MYMMKKRFGAPLDAAVAERESLSATGAARPRPMAFRNRRRSRICLARTSRRCIGIGAKVLTLKRSENAGESRRLLATYLCLHVRCCCGFSAGPVTAAFACTRAEKFHECGTGSAPARVTLCLRDA